MGMDYEDVCPALVAMPVERVLIDDVIYGWENDGNYRRKGWTLLAEPIKVDARGLRDIDAEYRGINEYQLAVKYVRYVLIRKPSD